MSTSTPSWTHRPATGLLIMSDGTIIEGFGLGATGEVNAELCFNTALTGYQEILTDPSYMGQVVTFTFPHIGNVGTNDEDLEDLNPANHAGAVGAIFKDDITSPSNYRSDGNLNEWLKKRNLIALCGIDTRALTALIREKGMPNIIIAHDPNGVFDRDALVKKAASWQGIEGHDLAKQVTSGQSSNWTQTPWVWNEGFGDNESVEKSMHIVAVDFGVKRNILRLLADLGAKVTIVPATTCAQDILALQPDGIFLSNGPGDPAATGEYSVPMIKQLVESNIPLFGICLGHQMLALALGASTKKMHQGHHGANHPVKDHTTGKVEIVSMNHGFAVDGKTLPSGVEETHVSLFDGSNCGLAVTGAPVFSVQHHPEASPGPQDSHYLFARFATLIRAHQGALAPADH